MNCLPIKNFFKRYVEEGCERKSSVEACFGYIKTQHRNFGELFRDEKFLEFHIEERIFFFKSVIKRILEVIESNQKHTKQIENFDIFGKNKFSISVVCTVNEGERFLKTPKKEMENLLFQIITKEKLNSDSTTQLKMCSEVKENKILLSEAEDVLQLISNNIEIEKMIEHPLFWTDNDKIQLIIYCRDTFNSNKSEREKYTKKYKIRNFKHKKNSSKNEELENTLECTVEFPEFVRRLRNFYVHARDDDDEYPEIKIWLEVDSTNKLNEIIFLNKTFKHHSDFFIDLFMNYEDLLKNFKFH